MPPEIAGREVVVGMNEGVGTWKGNLRAPGVLIPVFSGGNVLFPTLDRFSLSRAVGVDRNPGVP